MSVCLGLPLALGLLGFFFFCFALYYILAFFVLFVKETTFSHILLQRATFESQSEFGTQENGPNAFRQRLYLRSSQERAQLEELRA